MQNTASPTLQNLEAAFAGESMAHIKYLWFARQCRKAGDEATTKVFEDTAAQEMLHAFGHAEPRRSRLLPRTTARSIPGRICRMRSPPERKQPVSCLPVHPAVAVRRSAGS